MKLSRIISALKIFKAAQPKANKARIETFFASQTPAVRKERSIYIGKDYAFRFSEANTGSSSNTVMGLSTLRNVDDVPVVVCMVRRTGLEFRLANATFLKKISHSAHSLRIDNIRGSFNFSNIMDQYEGIPNRPDHFDELIAIHSEFCWAENVERLVEATNSIVTRQTRFQPSSSELMNLFDSPSRAAAVLKSRRFKEVESELATIVKQNRDALLKAAALDNPNIRGNTIEQIVTGGVNAHRLDDLIFDIAGAQFVVDIKTKLLDRASAPKAYNIDKMLRTLSQTNATSSFFFIGLDTANGMAYCRLISVFDPVIIGATRIQAHWAGRGSRGVTQLTGDLSRIFEADYLGSVDIEKSKELLRSFLER